MKTPSWEYLNQLISSLDDMFPNAKCELEYNNLFELIIAVSLSAQTTDKRVNEVCKQLFSKYKDYNSLANADISTIKEILEPLGMQNTKSKNIILLSKKIVELGRLPENYDELVSLPGIGRKCANVILAEFFKEPRLAVDTHVLRTSKRLGLASGSPLNVEKELMRLFDNTMWYYIHIHLVYLGRYVCKAKNPNCIKCLIKNCPNR